MSNYSPVWPHDHLTKAFDEIYVIRGTNVTYFEDIKIQHSRNMTIIEDNGDLTLINSVRLDEEGLTELDQLGTVKHIIDIGAFHGRDDAFYLDRYNANLWTVKEKKEQACHHRVHALNDTIELPIENAHFHGFKDSTPKEGFLFIESKDGIIITCDSIKNWVKVDNFFSEETANMAISNGEISKARISPIWLNATGVQKNGFDGLLNLKFKHLISAHGDILRDTAHADIQHSVAEIS